MADDSADMRTLFYDILSGRHEVVLAHDGQAAIHLLRAETFHAVVSDLEMPHADGTEVMHEAGQQGVPIRILASGRGVDHLRTLVHDVAVKLLSKPFRIPELLAAMAP